MAEDNWIRKLKSSGNDMADAEAKNAVKTGIASADQRLFCSPWSLINKDNGLPIEWTALPKAVMLYNKKRRLQRLADPTKSLSETVQNCFGFAAAHLITFALVHILLIE